MQNKQAVIEEYAKKIYGFSMKKTGNVWDAEDLSQEITLALCTERVWQKEIGYLDAYIYRICKYTWSNFLRRNVRHWRSLENGGLTEAVSDSEPEAELLQREELRRLRQEVLYLSRLRRRITVLYYYDGKKSREIAELLSIPAATVRWHLAEARNIMKERMEMTETKLYEPQKLLVGHCGNVRSPVYQDLQNDMLTQNICWACREKALSMEELAQTLGVAAVYLEYKMEQLVDMDYMRKVGGSKYRTGFYIWDDDFQIKTEQFRYARALSLGLPLYQLLKNHLPELRRMEGIPAAGDNFLLWALLPGLISGIFDRVQEDIRRESGTAEDPPKRSDGSAHWLIVRTRFRDRIGSRADLPEDFRDYCVHGDVRGVKTREAGRLRSLQYDLMCFHAWREFESWDLLQLEQVYTLLSENRAPGGAEREVIAGLAEKGYVTVEGGQPYIQIPFIKGTALAEQMRRWLPEYLDLEAVRQVYLEYGRLVDSLLPGDVDPEEQAFLRTDLAPEGAIMYALYQKGYLQAPTAEEQKRLCTLVWEE